MKISTHICIYLLFFIIFKSVAQPAGTKNCSNARPAIISGPREVCTGKIYTYCTNADPYFKSFVWTAPESWTIISGQGTNCVIVKAGSKPGIMKVKVNHASCGIKVRTKHVYPRNCSTVINPVPDEPVCVKQSACFGFTYLGKEDLDNNQTKIRFQLAVDCNRALSNVAFELPGNQPAISPVQNDTGNNKYTIENGTNNPFYAIKFEANNADAFKNGKADIFEYVVNTDLFYEHGSTIRVSAKAGLIVGSATFTTEACVEETPPVCPTPVATLEGAELLCAFQDNPVTYTAMAPSGSENLMFTWSVPADWKIISDSTASSILVKVGSEVGQVVAEVTNECGATTTVSMNVFTDENCSDLVALPVELLSFTGEATKTGVLLEWETASEKNNDKFEVERSADGNTFAKISEVKGNGTTSTRKTYSLRDTKASRGTHYYRLRQVDFDGTFNYSTVIAVENQRGITAGLLVAPNPVTNGQFTINLDVIEKTQLQILDTNGRLLLRLEMQPGTRELTLNALNLNMKSGLYLINTRSATATQHAKIIVR